MNLSFKSLTWNCWLCSWICFILRVVYSSARLLSTRCAAWCVQHGVLLATQSGVEPLVSLSCCDVCSSLHLCGRDDTGTMRPADGSSSTIKNTGAAGPPIPPKVITTACPLLWVLSCLQRIKARNEAILNNFEWLFWFIVLLACLLCGANLHVSYVCVA